MKQTQGDEPLLDFLVDSSFFKGVDREKLAHIADQLEVVHLREGALLFGQGDSSDALYVVESGRLRVSIRHEDGGETVVGEIAEGDPVGEIQILTGGSRTAEVSARVDSKLVKISKAAFETLVENTPEVLRHSAAFIRRRQQINSLIEVLPHLFGPLTVPEMESLVSSLEWLHLRRGETLFRQGDPADGLYIVINGRLQAVRRSGNRGSNAVGEISRGECVGEMALISGAPRSADVRAIRDTEVARLPSEAFDRLQAEFPHMIINISKILVQRLTRNITDAPKRRSRINLAMIPAGTAVPASEFTERLAGALSRYGSLRHLNSRIVDQALQTPDISQTSEKHPNHIRLLTWLGEQEMDHEVVLYEADSGASQWSNLCLRQADHILIVGEADGDPVPGKMETALLGNGNCVPPENRSLVLLHTAQKDHPTGTRTWLDHREVACHHHVRWNKTSDFSRLARVLTGNAVGLVLGGGGARGYAHIGALQALEEEGVPVDMIGGASMGAVIAAAYAMGMRCEEIAERNRDLFRRHDPFREYTLPIISVLRSRRLERLLKEGFGDMQVEDLWLNLFCISSNLSTAEVAVHRGGSLWGAIRSSVSLPGIVVPVIQGRNLLVDGGVLNNLPVDVMQEACGGTVIAVDVSSQNDLLLDDAMETMPSPWKMVWNRINPFEKKIKVPTILSVMGRTAMLGSVAKRNEVKNRSTLYLNPPVEQFGFLEMSSVDEIAKMGYEYAIKKIRDWKTRTPDTIPRA